MEVLTLRKDASKIKRVARMLKTISNPTRLAIIDLLLERGELSVTSIYEALEIGQSNASQHLKALEDVGVLGSERRGKSIIYRIENQHVSNLLECVNECTTC